MKTTLICILLAISLLACTSPKGPAMDTNKEKMDVNTVADNQYTNHFVSCRAEQSADVDRILQVVENKPGVILYFHGGLSDDEYMKTKLGPWLMQSTFREENLNGFHPIFVNYDAGLLDLKKLLREFLKKERMKNIRDIIIKRLDEKASEKHIRQLPVEERYSQAAREILLFDEAEKAVPWEKLGQMLVDEALQEQRANKLYQDELMLARAADELNELIKEERKDKFAGLKNPMKPILKIIVRFAIKTNHQVVPTIEEEILRELKIAGVGPATIAQRHWEKVYKHSQSCWQILLASR